MKKYIIEKDGLKYIVDNTYKGPENKYGPIPKDMFGKHESTEWLLLEDVVSPDDGSISYQCNVDESLKATIKSQRDSDKAVKDLNQETLVNELKAVKKKLKNFDKDDLNSPNDYKNTINQLVKGFLVLEKIVYNMDED